MNNDRTVEHVVNIYKIYSYVLYYVENIFMFCTINTTWRDTFYNADYAQCVNASILSCLYDSAVQSYMNWNVFSSVVNRVVWKIDWNLDDKQ